VAAYEEARSIRQTADGGFVVVGAQGPSPSAPATPWSLLIIRIDASGTVQWSETLDSSASNEAADSVVQASDGSYVVATEETSTAGQTVAGLLRLDAQGTLVWHKQSVRWSSGSSVRQTSDGGFVFGGRDDVVLRTDGNGHIAGCGLLPDAPVGAVAAG